MRCLLPTQLWPRALERQAGRGRGPAAAAADISAKAPALTAGAGSGGGGISASRTPRTLLSTCHSPSSRGADRRSLSELCPRRHRAVPWSPTAPGLPGSVRLAASPHPSPLGPMVRPVCPPRPARANGTSSSRPPRPGAQGRICFRWHPRCSRQVGAWGCGVSSGHHQGSRSLTEEAALRLIDLGFQPRPLRGRRGP